VIGTLILIALAMGWLRAQAQTTSGAVISGTVSIDHGRVAALRVKAKDTMRRIAYTVYTQKGRYNIYNLPAGYYEISILEEGIEPVTQALDLPAGKTVTANLNVRATAAAEERIGISGARAQENYGGVRGSAKATARIVDFETLYPPGRGRDLIQVYCLGCHGPGGFHQRGFGNEAVWRTRVERMFTRKSGILTDEPMIGTGVMSEEDKNTIIKSLDETRKDTRHLLYRSDLFVLLDCRTAAPKTARRIWQQHRAGIPHGRSASFLGHVHFRSNLQAC